MHRSRRKRRERAHDAEGSVAASIDRRCCLTPAVHNTESDAATTTAAGTMKDGSVSAEVVEAVDAGMVGDANWDARGGCAP